MRELRSCDFCDGDALGTFEVIPDELSPTETEQRRVVLCRDCRETLETVLEPFLARLGGESADSVGGGDGGGAGDGDDASSAGDEATPPTAAVDADARAEGIAVGRTEASERSETTSESSSSTTEGR